MPLFLLLALGNSLFEHPHTQRGARPAMGEERYLSQQAEGTQDQLHRLAQLMKL